MRRGSIGARLAAAPAAAALLLLARLAGAQEFAAPAPLPAESAAALLERALTPVAGGGRLEAIAIRWFGLPELGTASAALGGSWRGLRAAVGLSRTGAPEFGWGTAALAAGWTDARSGAALRAAVRLTNAPDAPRVGGEAGAGAWADAGERLRLWASAPQLWQDGEAPPLDRRLELGARLRAAGLELWLSRRTARGSGGGLRGEHAAGVAVRSGALTLWTHLEDAPARGGFGLGVAWRGLALSLASDLHPVLGETITFGVTAGGSP